MSQNAQKLPCFNTSQKTTTKNAQITLNVIFSSHYKSASDNSQNSKFDRPEEKKHKQRLHALYIHYQG
jgi:hypothetical protein